MDEVVRDTEKRSKNTRCQMEKRRRRGGRHARRTHKKDRYTGADTHTHLDNLEVKVAEVVEPQVVNRCGAVNHVVLCEVLHQTQRQHV